MSGKNISFNDKKNQKNDFYKNKKLNRIGDIDINKLFYQFLKKKPHGTKNSFKYFVRYNDNDVIRPLCIGLPKMTSYTRKLDENATMSFRVNYKQLLKNYNKIQGKH